MLALKDNTLGKYICKAYDVKKGSYTEYKKLNENNKKSNNTIENE